MDDITYADSLENVRPIPTGLFVDKLSGIGGIPRGYITEVFGDEGIGKSSLCLQIVAAAQKQGLRCLWADIEWCFEPRYAQSLGVRTGDLGLLRARYAEECLDRLIEAADSGKWDLIVLDSIGSLHPRAEAEKTAEEKVIGGQAGLVARFCRKIVPLLRLNDVAMVAINHAFIDLMTGKHMTSGGRKLAYHKALSIQLKSKFKATVLQSEGRRIGKTVIGAVKKNKLASTEGLEIQTNLYFGTGFSAVSNLLDDAVEAGVIEKREKTYYLGEEKLGVGLQTIRKEMEEKPELAEKIKNAYEAKKDTA